MVYNVFFFLTSKKWSLPNNNGEPMGYTMQWCNRFVFKMQQYCKLDLDEAYTFFILEQNHEDRAKIIYFFFFGGGRAYLCLIVYCLHYEDFKGCTFLFFLGGEGISMFNCLHYEDFKGCTFLGVHIYIYIYIIHIHRYKDDIGIRYSTFR